MSLKNNKRKRLVDAANRLFHQEGVTNTTLAMIAALADVPLGNVYYYFKSKESIILAVVSRRRKTIQDLMTQWDNECPAPAERLQKLIARAIDDAQESAQYGDALGSLCQELSKHGGSLATASKDLMNDVLLWCEAQFNALGKGELSHSHAVNLIASLQGISLLSLTFNDPKMVESYSQYLSHWLKELS
jgi:TetR/AcrR family transcriptional regulator, transcriptional repressor for nem operon